MHLHVCQAAINSKLQQCPKNPSSLATQSYGAVCALVSLAAGLEFDS